MPSAADTELAEREKSIHVDAALAALKAIHIDVSKYRLDRYDPPRRGYCWAWVRFINDDNRCISTYVTAYDNGSFRVDFNVEEVWTKLEN